MRWLARIVIYVTLAVLAAATAALWWAGNPRSLEWAVGRLAHAAGGRLEIRGATGSLLSGAHAREVFFSDKDLTITAAGVELDWSPLHLLAKRLVVSRLRAAKLTVDFPQPSAGPPVLPESLQPPIAMEIIEASIGELAIVQGGQPLRFTDLSLRLAGNRQAWRLKYGRITTPWGRVQAQSELGSGRPFPLKGNAEWLISAGGEPIPAQARWHGTLSGFELELKGEAKGAAVLVTAHLAPLQEHAVRRLLAHARGFDPGRWVTGWPRAAVGGEITLEAALDGGLRGQAALHNNEAGTLDQERIPLKGLAANIVATPGAVRFDELVLDLGGAGRIAGKAAWRDGILRLDGVAQDLNLRGVHGRLKATALGGDLAVESDGARQHVRAHLAQSNQAIELEASVSPQHVTLERARVRAGKSLLEGQGELGLGTTRPFKFEGKLARFDPSQLGDYPAARINADIGASGTLAPELEAEAKFRIRDSRLLDHPLHGQGRVSVSARGIESAQADLLIAGNELVLEGGLGSPQQRLHWRLNAPRLENLDARLAGRVRGSGYLGGAFEQLEVGFDIEAERLRVDKIHGIERLRASGRIEPGENGAIAGDAALEGYRGPGFSATSAVLAVRGARLDHSASLTASGEQLGLTAELQGAWRDGQWRGMLTRFTNDRGPFEARLERAAPLSVSATGYALSDAVLQLPSGRITVGTLAKQDSGFDARGSASGLRLIWLLERAGLRTEPLHVDLRLGAEWSLRLDQTLNGTLKVWREDGAIVLGSEPPLALEAQRFNLAMHLVENRLSLEAQIDAGRALRLVAQGTSEVSRQGERWGIAGNAPLTLSGTANADSLEWAKLFAPLPGLTTEGALKAEFAATGTAGAPVITGRLAANGLRILLPDQGLDLRDGEMAATFKGDQLLLERFALRGGEGRIEANGEASFGAQPRLGIKATASQLQLVSRPDRLLVVSGEVALGFDRGKVGAAGKLRADRGLFELPTQTVTVSEDVIVIGAQPKPGAHPAHLPLHAELDFDFGQDFALRGRGIDAQLAGMLRLVVGEAKPLSVHGNVSVVNGTYRAYGQSLKIERGVLNFNGPVNDPRLDILALRTGLKVEAGVEVLGTLLFPRIRLVSRPEVSDAEKLSWLALGHGLDRSSRGEISVLARAASALLASDESVSLQSRLAREGGLDELTIGGEGGLENAVVALGKRLSSQVYVSFEQGLANTTSVLKVQYELSRRWSVRTQTGTANAVDLFYSIHFD